MAQSMVPLYLSLVSLVGVLCYTVPSGISSYYEENAPDSNNLSQEDKSEASSSPIESSQPSTLVSSQPEPLENRTDYLTEDAIAQAEDYIQTYWQLAYPNHIFQSYKLTIHSEELDSPTPLIRQMGNTPAVYSQGAQWIYQVDFLYEATATLITAPSQHPLLQGMKQALAGYSQEEVALVSSTLARYEQTLLDAYQQPTPLTALYRLVFVCDFDPRSSSEPLPTPSYYFQQDDKDTNLIPKLSTFATGDASINQQLAQGEAALNSLLSQLKTLGSPTRSVSYDSTLAVNYARDHALDEPEYSERNGLGSDCANFVSFALQAGGFTEDVSGGWYPSQSQGAYGGLNWIRTGFTPSYGGVVLYMKQRNLFFQQNNTILSPKGSILFFHDHSHVALVTFSDGQVTTFSDHSNYQKEHSNFLVEGDFVDYYSPNPTIVVG